MDTGTVIGAVVSRSGEVTASSISGDTRQLELGSEVFADDQVQTGTDAVVVFEFHDGSRKGMAGDSAITLDRQVYDPAPAATDLQDTGQAAAAEDASGTQIAAPVDSPEQLGEVASASGLVVARAADGSERALQVGDPVFQGDTVSTDSGSLAIFRFADGTRKGLGSNAEIRLDDLSQGQDQVLAEAAPVPASNDIELLDDDTGEQPEVLQEPVSLGRLDSAQGEVFVTDTQGQERLLEPGDEILAGETLITDDGAAAVVELGDGSFRGISSGSEMAFNPDELPATAAGESAEGDEEIIAASDDAGAIPELEDAVAEEAVAQPVVAADEPVAEAAPAELAGMELAMVDDAAGPEADAVDAAVEDAVAAEPQEPVASLTGAIGDVRAVSASGEERALQAGDELYAGDVVLTGDGSVAVLGAGDDAARGLSSNSRFVVDEWLDSLPVADAAEAVEDNSEAAGEDEAAAGIATTDEAVADAPADADEPDAETAAPEAQAEVAVAEESDAEADDVEEQISLEEAQQATDALNDETDSTAADESADQPVAVASVSGVSGEVQALQDDGGERALDVGDELFAGERVLTGPDGTVMLDINGVVRGISGDSEVSVDELVAAAPDSAADQAESEVAASDVGQEDEADEEPAVIAEAEDQSVVDQPLEDAVAEAMEAEQEQAGQAAADMDGADIPELQSAIDEPDDAGDPEDAPDLAAEAAQAGERIGVLSSSMGEVEASSESGVRTLEPGDEVFSGERLYVSEDGVAILHLEDGRPLGLSGGSTLDLEPGLLQEMAVAQDADQGMEPEMAAADEIPDPADDDFSTDQAAPVGEVDTEVAVSGAEEGEGLEEPEQTARTDEQSPAQAEPQTGFAAVADESDAADPEAEETETQPVTELGTVSALSGNVLAVDAEGNERALDAGDALYAGEVVRTDPSSTVIVQLHSGGARGVAGDSTLQLTEEMAVLTEAEEAEAGLEEQPVSADAGAEAVAAVEAEETVAEAVAEDLEGLSEELVEAALAEVSGADAGVEVTPVAVAPEIGPQAGTAEALPMGRLVSSLGEVRAVAADGESRVLEIGDEIYPEETLVTDALGVATVELVDGSFRGISSDASLRIDESLLKVTAEEEDAAGEAEDSGQVSEQAQAVASAEAESVADPGEVETEAAAAPVASVNSLIGDVAARNEDGSSRELQAGDELYAGETLVTGEYSTAVIDFADGSQRGLASQAEMAVDSREISLDQDSEVLAEAGSATASGASGSSVADQGEPESAGGSADAEPVVIGSVSAASGELQAIASDGSARELAVGDPVFEGEVLETGVAGSAVIVLNDGSVRGLASDSSVTMHLDEAGPEAVPGAPEADETALMDAPQDGLLATDQEPADAGLMVGAVSAASGTVIAQDAAGSERELQAGDAVFENETIWTEAGSTAVLALQDGTSKGLASGSVMRLDADSIDMPGIREVIESKAMAFSEAPRENETASGEVHDDALEMSAMEDLDALQEAILAGADPSEEAEPTAAGWETTSEGSHEAVFIERSAQRTTPESGDLNTGVLAGAEFSGAPDDEITLATSVGAAPDGGGGDGREDGESDPLAQLLAQVGMTRDEFGRMLEQQNLTEQQFTSMSAAQQRTAVSDFRDSQQEDPSSRQASSDGEQVSDEDFDDDGESQVGYRPSSPYDSPLIITADEFEVPDGPTFTAARSSRDGFDADQGSDRITNVLSEDRIEFSFDDEQVPGTTPASVPSNLLAEALIMEFEAPEGTHEDPVIFNLNDADTETFLIHNFHTEDGDLLKVHDLLLDGGLDANQSTEASVLAQYMHFDYDSASQSTRILVGHTEGDEFMPDHTIVLDQVDVTNGGVLDDAAIISNLISANNLDVATAQLAGPGSNSFNLLDVTPGGEFLI